MGRLPDKSREIYKREEPRLVLEALTQLRLADSDALCQVEEGASHRATLDQLLTRLEQLLRRLSDDMTARYFQHAEAIHQLVPTHPEQQEE